MRKAAEAAVSSSSLAATLAREERQSLQEGAIDVVVVPQEDGSLRSTPFHVRFGKLQLLKPQEKRVSITVNDRPVNLTMKLGYSGEAFFVEDSTDAVPLGFATSPPVGSSTATSTAPMEDFTLDGGSSPGASTAASRPSTRPSTPPLRLDAGRVAAAARVTSTAEQRGRRLHLRRDDASPQPSLSASPRRASAPALPPPPPPPPPPKEADLEWGWGGFRGARATAAPRASRARRRRRRRTPSPPPPRPPPPPPPPAAPAARAARGARVPCSSTAGDRRARGGGYAGSVDEGTSAPASPLGARDDSPRRGHELGDDGAAARRSSVWPAAVVDPARPGARRRARRVRRRRRARDRARRAGAGGRGLGLRHRAALRRRRTHRLALRLARHRRRPQCELRRSVDARVAALARRRRGAADAAPLSGFMRCPPRSSARPRRRRRRRCRAFRWHCAVTCCRPPRATGRGRHAQPPRSRRLRRFRAESRGLRLRPVAALPPAPARAAARTGDGRHRHPTVGRGSAPRRLPPRFWGAARAAAAAKLRRRRRQRVSAPRPPAAAERRQGVASLVVPMGRVGRARGRRPERRRRRRSRRRQGATATGARSARRRRPRRRRRRRRHRRRRRRRATARTTRGRRRRRRRRRR